MKDVGFNDVVELMFLTQPRSDREASLRQQSKESRLGNQPGNSGQFSAGGTA
jgi:hypothetical protein